MMNFLGKLVTGLSKSQGYGVSNEDEEQELDEKKKKRKPQAGLMSLMAPSEEEADLSSSFTPQIGRPSGANPLQLYGNMYRSYGGRKTRGLLFD